MHKHRRNPILLGQDNNALTWLLIINAVVFVIINFIKVLYYFEYDTSMEASHNFYPQILNWISLPASWHVYLTRPWTILTYMFTHESVWALIGTLLWLWAFGYILQDLTGNSKLIPAYIYGGMIAGIFFLLSSNLIPSSLETIDTAAPYLGGQAAVLSVGVAATTIAPKYKLFPMINGGIPLWVLTLLFITVDYATVAIDNNNIAIAHLASAIVGFIYGYQLERGNDLGEWMVNFYNWVNDLFNPEKKYKNKIVEQRHYKAARKPFEKSPRVTQQKLDEILDKINQQGYHALSPEEKDFLKKASQEDL
jgi:membrane associated rhomboid family serine protease